MRRLRRITLTALALAWLLSPRRPPGPRAVSPRAALIVALAGILLRLAQKLRMITEVGL